MEEKVLMYDPSVFVMGNDYQIIFLTATKGLGWIEIDGERYLDEEGGLLIYDTVHKISVPGDKLNAAGHYTVVFVEYADKKPYFPEGVEKIRREYKFYPLTGDDFRLFQFADTHARVKTPIELYEQVGDCDIILLNGDINEHSYAIENFYTSFELAGKSARGERPVIYSRGNHDTRGLAAQLLPNYTPTAYRDGKRETFYTFRQGSLWGLVLDCGEDKRDTNAEYGGTISFSTFRDRETKYLESLIENAENEYAAPDVKHRIAFCHIPFVMHFKPPFDIEEERYEYWIRLLEKMGIELLLCGHEHNAFFIKPHTAECMDASFPVAICSIPSRKREDGTDYYTGGLIEVKDGVRRVKIIPGGEEIEF